MNMSFNIGNFDLGISSLQDIGEKFQRYDFVLRCVSARAISSLKLQV